MFIRFRQMTAQRYGHGEGEERECVGKCKDRPRYYPRWGEGFIVKGRTFLQGCPMKPLCPLVEKRHRLEVSIVETRREGGKVKQQHIASLGSITGNSLAARESFWLECEARLARLANRLGPETERLRQAIAARIPPLTDADRDAMDAAAWDGLEGFWDDLAKRKAYHSSDTHERAKEERRKATELEAFVLQAKRLRGNPKAFNALNRLLGMSLSPLESYADCEDAKRLKAEISRLVESEAT
jgi:hypothetical protein